MTTATFYNMKLLCYINDTDFTDYQGIGTDPMYKRYDSVIGVIKNHIAPEYQGLLARPFYEDGTISWFVNEWNDSPICLNHLTGLDKVKYLKIKEDTLAHYRDKMQKMPSEEFAILSCALKYISDDFIYCYDNKIVLIAWGMRPDTSKHQVAGSWIKGLKVKEKFKIEFKSSNHVEIKNPTHKISYKDKGYILSEKDIPELIIEDGYRFISWTPSPIGHEVASNVCFEAVVNKIKLEDDSNIIQEEMESSEPLDNHDSENIAINKTEEKEIPIKQPWYKKLWLWLTEKGCLKWVLWLLLFILLIFLLSWMFKGCSNDSSSNWDNYPENSLVENNDFPSKNRIIDDESIVDDGRGEDRKDDKINRGDNRGDNKGKNRGKIKDIRDKNGNLPGNSIIAPITGDNGETPDIVHNEGFPDIIANRLNIYFENEDADLNKWVQDFKRLYPSDDYSVIGYDENVKIIQIQIPESERQIIREELPSKITDQKFFIVDESIITLNNKNFLSNSSNIGWHIRATNLEKGWKITEGNPEIIVSIVDDGIDVSHPIFNGRIYKPYNVFTQTSNLGTGMGHGTHVAGLASGSKEFISKGACGVAPKCKIMPIQVFENNMCTFSSIASGIMYAIHNGADVVNISIGPRFHGLDALPLAKQREIAQTEFKNEELVYKHIINTANKKNVILVFAAGNDNIMTAILPECRLIGKTLNVAAVSPELKATNFTNYSSGTNISAPGEDIYSSFPSNTFKSLDGTSMAAPIVTGTIALMKSIKNDLTVEETIQILRESGKPVGQFIPNMIQIDKALKMLSSGDYLKLLEELEQLKLQRDSLDKKIDNIENKLN